MAWNPKTVAGKLLKTSAKAGLGVLGMMTGTTLIGTAAGAIASGISKGTLVKAKPGGALDNIRTTADRVAQSARNLVTGYTKELNQVTNETKEKVRMQVGDAIGEHTITNADGIQTTVKKQAIADFLKSDGVKYAAIGLAALFILPKILKR